MQKEDWQKVAKWIGIAYLPIGLFVLIVFLVVEWQAMKIRDTESQMRANSATSTLIK